MWNRLVKVFRHFFKRNSHDRMMNGRRIARTFVERKCWKQLNNSNKVEKSIVSLETIPRLETGLLHFFFVVSVVVFLVRQMRCKNGTSNHLMFCLFWDHQNYFITYCFLEFNIFWYNSACFVISILTWAISKFHIFRIKMYKINIIASLENIKTIAFALLLFHCGTEANKKCPNTNRCFRARYRGA